MNDEMFNELLASVQEMNGIVKGNIEPSRVFEYPEPGVKNIREKAGLSQTRFALLIGVSKRTLKGWEKGRRPYWASESPVRIVNADPEHTMRSLHG